VDESPGDPDLPTHPPDRWTFSVDEISNGAWEGQGTDPDGHVVSRQGSDPDAVLRSCWAAAAWVDHSGASDINER
jgi:hypothetical protein